MGKFIKGQNVADKLTAFVGSVGFYRLLLLLFVIGAGWIAVSGRFPMPFDESTHLAFINYYSQHANPFGSFQPAELNQYGPIIHNPSYLYHYLMGLPWRIITIFVKNFMVQVILLRLLNVAMFAVGIAIFKKVLSRVCRQGVIVNLVLFFFVMTPLVPQVAAQINYDNLFFPLLAFSLLLAIDVTSQIKMGALDLKRLIILAVVCLLASIVKYTFLPVFAGIFLFSVWQYMHRRQGDGFAQQTKAKYRLLGAGQKILLIGLLLLSLGLFLERYGLNMLRYHTPLPNCVQVIGEAACRQSSLYQRELLYAHIKPASFNSNPLYFTLLWVRHMGFNLLFALNGQTSGYTIGLPFVLPKLTTELFCTVGFVLSVIFWRSIFKNLATKLFCAVALLYCMSLWGLNYSAYLDLGRRVAIQGRYLIALLPVIYFVFVLGFHNAFSKYKNLRFTLASIALFGMLAGGGALTFILHSDADWYWHNRTVLQFNQTTQSVLRPVLPGSQYEAFHENE